MTNERSPENGAWDSEDAEDNEQTTVARNPLLSPPPDNFSGMVAADTDLTPVPARESGPPGRRSLYERLIEAGALEPDPEADQAVAAGVPAAAQELPAISAGAYGAAANLPPLKPSRGLPRAPNEFEIAYLRAESSPPEATRPSTVPLRDSDLEMLRRSEADLVRRDSDGFISALAADPDVDEPPVSARFRRPPELASAPTPPQLPLPSMLLSPQISTRHDSTERISTAMPKTHPLANSVAPTAIPASRRGDERRASSMWFAVIAAALVGVGVAVVGLKLPREREQKAAASAPRAREAQPAVEAPSAQPGASAPVVVPVQPAAEVPVDPKQLAEDEARERRHRLRAEREAQKLAAAGQATPGEAEAEPAKPAEPQADKPASAEPAVVAKPEKADPIMPTQPTRDQVVAAMNSVLPALKECVGDKHGTADVTVTVRSAGFVSYAIVGGTFVGTPEGSCIAKVVRDARFPTFTDAFIRVTYPYQL